MKIPILLIAFLSIQMIAQEYPDYLPLVREGVTWVNEKVIVSPGDTTIYYYKYEFSGFDSIETNFAGEINNACYYYTGDELDVEQDSLIAGLRNHMTSVTCVRNNAYKDNLRNNKCVFKLAMFADGGTIILYCFNEVDIYDGNFMDNVDYYLMCQDDAVETYGIEPLLTSDNFIRIDPIMIENVSCSRCAYINEQGDTAAYVVEGIGFDSYDMGDLLTPFTRKPDPDADYQEWCGLSHVVKDGQIIYKGMRYRDGAYNAIDVVVADQRRPMDDNYYDLMGRAVGKDVPTTPGIYIHNGNKIVIR